MSERITRDQLDRAVFNLNRRLEAAGSAFRVAAQGRYDYTAVDELRRSYSSPDHEASGLASWAPYGNAVVAGTKRECYEAVQYMLRGIDYASTKET